MMEAGEEKKAEGGAAVARICIEVVPPKNHNNENQNKNNYLQEKEKEEEKAAAAAAVTKEVLEVFRWKTVESVKRSLRILKSDLFVCRRGSPCLLYEGRVLRDEERLEDFVPNDSLLANSLVTLHLVFNEYSEKRRDDDLEKMFINEMVSRPKIVVDKLSLQAADKWLSANSGSVKTEADVKRHYSIQHLCDRLMMEDNVEFHESDTFSSPSTSSLEPPQGPEQPPPAQEAGGEDAVEALLRGEIHDEPFPNLIAFRPLVRIAFGLLLFGRMFQEVTTRVILSVVYYLFDVGLIGYLYRRYFQRAAELPTPGEPPRHRFWHVFCTIPRRNGPAMDVLALLIAFMCSLFPSWNVQE